MPNPDHMGQPGEVSGVALAPELTRYLPYLMRRAFAYVSANADPTGLARDFAVLASLADQKVPSQQELAERLEINRTIMVKLIDRLQASGYVTRTRNPDNRRSYVLSLTDAGHDALTRMQPAVLERDTILTTGLTADERERLGDLLRAVLGSPERTTSTLSTEYLITQAFYVLRRRGDAMLSDLGLRVRNFGPLFAISKLGPCPQQHLARYLAVTEPAAAQIVEELVRAGLVARGQDPLDRRRYALELTELGEERFAALLATVERLQADIVAEVGGPENEAEIHTLILKLLPAAAPEQPDLAEIRQKSN